MDEKDIDELMDWFAGAYSEQPEESQGDTQQTDLSDVEVGLGASGIQYVVVDGQKKEF
jgi:hypothetical protein